MRVADLSLAREEHEHVAARLAPKLVDGLADRLEHVALDLAGLRLRRSGAAAIRG